jgi:DNA repair protein RadA/Sms
MTERGLAAVPNPSAVFLAARSEGTSGSAVTALMEGTRPVLVEVQALAAPRDTGPRSAWPPASIRSAWPCSWLCWSGGAARGLPSWTCSCRSPRGSRLREPGADLAVAAALLSSLHNIPTPADALYLGEIGLGGGVRPIGGLERRLAEASRLELPTAFASPRQGAQDPDPPVCHFPTSRTAASLAA